MTNNPKPSRGLRQRGRAEEVAPKRPWMMWAIGGVLLVLVVLVVVRFANQARQRAILLSGVEQFSGAAVAQGHAEGTLSYPVIPPVGGKHNPIWQNCGIYDALVPNEYGVHSMEHGAVWITYQPDLPAETVEQLRAIVRGRDYVLLSPYEGLPAPVVASAWGVQLKMEGADESALESFIAAYSQGPQTPEPGASCRGGVGTPMEG